MSTGVEYAPATQRNACRMLDEHLNYQGDPPQKFLLPRGLSEGSPTVKASSKSDFCQVDTSVDLKLVLTAEELSLNSGGFVQGALEGLAPRRTSQLSNFLGGDFLNVWSERKQASQ